MSVSKRQVTHSMRYKIQDVLHSNGEEYLLQDIMQLVPQADDEPPVILRWNDDRVCALAAAIEVAIAQMRSHDSLPDPLHLPVPFTVLQLKKAVLSYISACQVKPSQASSRHGMPPVYDVSSASSGFQSSKPGPGTMDDVRSGLCGQCGSAKSVADRHGICTSAFCKHPHQYNPTRYSQ